MGQAFELFAAEYGWDNNFILDNLTPAQFQLYLEMALSRIDDNRRFQEELTVAQSGGSLQDFRRSRRTVREIIADRKKNKGKADPKEELHSRKTRIRTDDNELTEEGFRQWAAIAGMPIYDSTRGSKELISRPHRIK